MTHDASQAGGPMTATTIGSMNYHVLRTILAHGKILKLNRGAEVGVLYGDTSAYLLREFPELKLFCIDPYLAYEEYHEDGRTQRELSIFEAVTRDKLGEFGGRGEIIKAFSTEASAQFENGSLDFVFIDANHDYQFIKSDIESWYPKVRAGGLVSGHDYTWPDVGRAVNEFATKSGLCGYFTPKESDVWFFSKPER